MLKRTSQQQINCLILACLLGVLPYLALAADKENTKVKGSELPINSELQALLHKIYSISTVGQWRYDGEEGNYRIISLRKGENQLQTKLYIQWLTFPRGKKDPKVYATVSIDEVNGPGIYSFKMPEFYVDKRKRNILSLQPTNLYTLERSKMKIEIHQNPGYSVLSHREEDRKVRQVLDRMPASIQNYSWPSF